MKCESCNGTGRIELLTSTKPCAECGGSGIVFPPDGRHDGLISQLNRDGNGGKLASGVWEFLDTFEWLTPSVAGVDLDGTYAPRDNLTWQYDG
jgi:hypothetical protein